MDTSIVPVKRQLFQTAIATYGDVVSENMTFNSNQLFNSNSIKIDETTALCNGTYRVKYITDTN